MKKINQLRFAKLLKIVLTGWFLIMMLVSPISINAQDPAETIDPDTFRVTDETLDEFDPLLVDQSKQAETLSTPGGIISRMLEFAFPLAGMVMFVMIVAGGFQILTGATGQKSMEEGKKKITTAIIGFILLFSSYWIAQILEKIFNIRIL
ncbi:MAG: hypothetical protein A2383_00335 [Candidatus Pacebacteria bacterium RIFOXYB1_FULL_39_46]|nr:MAG: hypothetical protein A2182_00165 [Candidatus Pacebacteria bacterium RIFOXYA1_FULL_38_18]OGJ38035.1 MAG: hypothetical protein A2383_00335 [Candidatus Pacebacteria bacterium RIFOXYB1_FULL_39_46]OGJ39742.1 MAG: hypothetical protein A2411_03110 [Candidatus Pacebacteria bacterium RIFOXYC1_FULL_39_21]OGJ39787.1 MAG: hypothetical protein A2582_00100 [Candidatus Pacebacteria bacterium RIFOXYD1_FULL_39_27]